MRCEQSQRQGVGHSAFRIPHSAFTLVELLVVIAIIGLLAALLVAAVGPAITRANQARITAEITQIDTAIKDYKTAVGSFPPNAQIDDLVLTGAESPSTPLGEATIKSEFERHLLKAFPNHREPPQLVAALIGLSPLAQGGNPTAASPATNLPGGMTAAEALVFWIGGFSSDPEYPISGTGGPSYVIAPAQINPALPNEADPIENRGWRLGIKIENLAPRGADNFFPQAYNRFITYLDPRDNTTPRRINFWVLNAPGTKTPYLYFDTSRGAGATAANDTPAATTAAITSMGDPGESQEVLEELGTVHALKTPNNDASAALRFVYANNKTFQVLHPGVDDRWIAMPVINPNLPTNPALDDWLVTSGTTTKDPRFFPDGPWVEELADTLTNFTESTLEDAQP